MFAQQQRLVTFRFIFIIISYIIILLYNVIGSNNGYVTTYSSGVKYHCLNTEKDNKQLIENDDESHQRQRYFPTLNCKYIR